MRGVIPITEAQAERAVVELFRLYGWEVKRIREDITRGCPGIPDLLCTALNGLQLWVEMKRPPSRQNPRGRVRPKQKETLIAWRARGVLCCVADDAGDSVLREVVSIGADRRADPDLHLRRLAEGAILALCDELMVGYDWWPA